MATPRQLRRILQNKYRNNLVKIKMEEENAELIDEPVEPSS